MAPAQRTVSVSSHFSEESSQSSDESYNLVVRIRQGDEQAFEELYRTFMPRLADFAYRYVGSQEDAYDLVHDVFLRLWRRRDNLTIQGTVTNYLYLAMLNTVRNRFAHERVVRQWEQRAATDIVSATAPDDVFAMLEANERHAQISRALSELPERRRAVCMLRWIKGMSYAEIAQQLGISEKTVSTQLDRGFRDIKQRLLSGGA